MSCYEKFKLELDEEVKGLTEGIEVLVSRASKIKNRLEGERENKASLESRLQKLKDLSGESLSGEEGDYAKYRTSLRKLMVEAETSNSMIASLVNETLPAAEKKLAEAKSEFSIKVWAFITTIIKPDLLKQCKETFGAFLAVPEDYYGSIERLCSAFGVRHKTPQSLMQISFNVSKYEVTLFGADCIEVRLLRPSNRPPTKR